jgi:hypothetical protein
MEIASRSTVDNTQAGPRPVSCRSRSSNKPGKMVIDGRSHLGRRLLDLAESLAAQLGGWAGMSDTLAANVRTAAELAALAEQTRADALRNGNIDLDQVIRLQGAADRAIRRLNIADHKQAPAEESLAQYLAAQTPAEAASEDEDESEPAIPAARRPAKRRTERPAVVRPVRTP